MRRPGSMETSLDRWISIIHRYGQSYLEKQCDDLDIGYGQLAFIRALSRRDGLSQEELSEVLSIDKTTTARAIKTLVELGYVSRSPDSTDGRIYHLSLTAKAIAKALATWFSKRPNASTITLSARVNRPTSHSRSRASAFALI